MKLTVQFTEPLFKGMICGHCDELIVPNEDDMYIKFTLGKTQFGFHEDCFGVVLSALTQFNKIFIEEQMRDKDRMMN